MAKSLPVTHKQRADTSANWSSVNPVLQVGEIGIVTDTSPVKMKIGDGSSAWNSLPFYDIVTVGTATSLANLPVNKHQMIVTISSAQQTFSYSTTPASGFNQLILLKNSSSSSITQAIPNSGSWLAVDGVNLVIPAYGEAELHVWYIDNKYRVAKKS